MANATPCGCGINEAGRTGGTHDDGDAGDVDDDSAGGAHDDGDAGATTSGSRVSDRASTAASPTEAPVATIAEARTRPRRVMKAHMQDSISASELEVAAPP
jgi:hypothetical protein